MLQQITRVSHTHTDTYMDRCTPSSCRPRKGHCSLSVLSKQTFEIFVCFLNNKKAKHPETQETFECAAPSPFSHAIFHGFLFVAIFSAPQIYEMKTNLVFPKVLPLLSERCVSVCHALHGLFVRAPSNILLYRTIRSVFLLTCCFFQLLLLISQFLFFFHLVLVDASGKFPRVTLAQTLTKLHLSNFEILRNKKKLSTLS